MGKARGLLTFEEICVDDLIQDSVNHSLWWVDGKCIIAIGKITTTAGRRNLLAAESMFILVKSVADHAIKRELTPAQITARGFTLKKRQR